MNESHTGCSSEIGITVGLVDSVNSILKVLVKRDLDNQETKEAISDLITSNEFHYIQNFFDLGFKEYIERKLGYNAKTI